MQCAKCGAENDPRANYCNRCGVPMTPGSVSPPPPLPTAGVQTSGKAIASLVLGIISIFGCVFGVVAAIPGIILGFIARSEIKRQPDRVSGEGVALAGIILSAIGTVIGVVIILGSFTLGYFNYASAFQSFQGSSRRPSVSRVRADMRSMSTAIESYFIDWNTYPVSSGNAAVDLRAITTPISYIMRPFPDPFAPTRNTTYRYYTPDPKEGWILWSPGPDGIYDLLGSEYDPLGTVPSESMIGKTYDPTNGAVSRGDIWRVKNY